MIIFNQNFIYFIFSFGDYAFLSYVSLLSISYFSVTSLTISSNLNSELQVTSVLFVAAVKSLPVHLINDGYIFDQQDIIVLYTCYVKVLVYSFWPFLTWVVPVFLHEYCLITLMICCLLFKFVF
jgi:hypothetical protein